MHYIFDCETDEWNKDKALELHKTYSVQYLDIKLVCIMKFEETELLEKRYFFDSSQFLRYLLEEYRQERKTLKIYSHNLDFDIKFILSNLSGNGLKLIPVKNNRLLSMKCYRIKVQAKNNKKIKKKVFEFRDSYAIIPLSIKKIGKIVGLEKIEIDYNESDKSNSEWVRYCFRDCEICQKGLEKICELFKTFDYPIEISELPLTLPSLSLKLFMKENEKYEFQKELKEGKSLKKNGLFEVPPKLNQIFREYYFGGKTECLHFGIGVNVNYYDYNSKFPDIMINHLFPIPPYISLKNNKHNQPNEYTFALLCLIDESKSLFPLIPTKENNKTVFTAKSKKCLLHREEFDYLKSIGIPIEILEFYNCNRWENPFSYMKNIYETRKQFVLEKNPLEGLCKLPMNSTYGKFAQNTEIEEREILPLSEINFDKLLEMVEKGKIDSISLESKTYHFKEKKQKSIQIDHINVVFASRITALARLELTQTISMLHSKGVIVYYCDTDSLVCSKDSEQYLTLNNELGSLKIEKEFQYFLCLAPKEYLFTEKSDSISGMNIFSEKNKIKGVSQNSNIQDYITKGIESIRPTKIFEADKRHIAMNTAITILKRKNTFFSKRMIKSDLSTNPIQSNNPNFEIIEKHNKKFILKQIKKWSELIE